MFQTKALVLALSFLSIFPSRSFASDLCQKILSSKNKTDFSMINQSLSHAKVLSDGEIDLSIYDFLSIGVDESIKRVYFGDHPGMKGLLPESDLRVFSAIDMEALDGFPVDNLKDTDYVVETEFGYAVMSAENFRYWKDLAKIISDPKKAKDYIETASNTENLYLPGLTRSAFDWLRWSVNAELTSFNEAKKVLGVKGKNGAIDSLGDMFELKDKLYDEMVRKKEFFIFPFGVDKKEKFNFISEESSVRVLSLLAKYFVLSNLYVERDNEGVEYIKLSEVLDRDSLMLMSRFPELLPAASVFESGHFKIVYAKTKITHDDSYRLSKVKFPTKKFRYTDFKSSFRSYVREVKGDARVSGYLTMTLAAPDIPSSLLSVSFVKKLYEIELKAMNKWLIKMLIAFNDKTGYSLPPVRFKLLPNNSNTFERNYKVQFALDMFGNPIKTPPHVLTAFYVFIGIKQAQDR